MPSDGVLVVHVAGRVWMDNRGIYLEDCRQIAAVIRAKARVAEFFRLKGSGGLERAALVIGTEYKCGAFVGRGSGFRGRSGR